MNFRKISCSLLPLLFFSFFSACDGTSGSSSGQINVTGGPKSGSSSVIVSVDTPRFIVPPDDGLGPRLGSGISTQLPQVNISLTPSLVTDAGTTRDIELFSAEPNAGGLIELVMSLVNTTSFQTVVVANLDIVTMRLRSPSGQLLLDKDSNSPPLSYGLSVGENVNVLGYPTRGADRAVVQGAYTQRLSLSRGEAAGMFTGAVIAKNDPNLNEGHLRVNIFLAGTEAQKQATRDAVDSALALWRSIFAARGLTLSVSFFSIPNASGVLPNPTIGSEFYLNALGLTGVQALAVNLFLAEDISLDSSTSPGNTFGPGVVGVSPAVPGAATSTIRSAIAISLNEHSGVDGIFNEEETALLGETLAHETGHYLGLFHPVEFLSIDDLTFTPGDQLSDTPVCSTLETCVDNNLVENLMFPASLFDVSQQTITENQAQVLHLQALVD